MKITEEKHNHKLTNLLKVFIFSVLMILPFLNIAVRCGYVMLNKNAYHSYYGETINERNLTKTNVLEINTNYQFQNDQYFEIVPTVQPTTLYVSDLKINNTSYENVNYISFFSSSNAMYYAVYFTDSQTTLYLNLASSKISAEFILNSFQQPSASEIGQYLDSLYKITYNKYSYLDNVFEYSINKLQEEQYLTWTENTAVYQGVETMTTQLGITQTVIPMLIVYWFMLTIIYVIIDIVLALFTKLTHIIGNKTTQ